MAESVKLLRSPIDTTCAIQECRKTLSFGMWVYYNPNSGEAICPDCGVKRGWTSKRRAKQLIKALELQEDIKSLKRRRKIETKNLVWLQQTVNIHKLGAKDLDLEKQILKLMETVKDYLKNCGTQKEVEAFNKVFNAIRQTQELQAEIRQEVESHLFVVDKKMIEIEPKREHQFVSLTVKKKKKEDKH